MKPRDNPCLFCAIVAGHVPCHAVYEDEHLLAFLDHRPLNPGHVLVVPKRHEPDFHRLASAQYGLDPTLVSPAAIWPRGISGDRYRGLLYT